LKTRGFLTLPYNNYGFSGGLKKNLAAEISIGYEK